MTDKERKIAIRTIDEMYLVMRVVYMTYEEKVDFANLIEISKQAEEKVNVGRKKKSNITKDRNDSGGV